MKEINSRVIRFAWIVGLHGLRLSNQGYPCLIKLLTYVDNLNQGEAEGTEGKGEGLEHPDRQLLKIMGIIYNGMISALAHFEY